LREESRIEEGKGREGCQGRAVNEELGSSVRQSDCRRSQTKANVPSSEETV
jgi:hypothetical protein